MTANQNPTPPQPEMHSEISALIGAIAKAFAITESQAIEALERDAVAMEFQQDSNGNRYVAATYDGQTARIYQGAIKRPNDSDS